MRRYSTVLLVPFFGLALGFSNNNSRISPACRDQAVQILTSLNDTGATCASTLTKVFNEVNSNGYSMIQTKCIGNEGLRECFGIDDVFTTTGISTLNSVSDCELCAERIACQDLLTTLAANITASPGDCSVPGSGEDNDLETIVFLRFQLDIFCADEFSFTHVAGNTKNLRYITQCQCASMACPPGILCEENTHPVLCPAGFYCPAFAGDKIECPEGYFCPEGSSSKTQCSAGAHCPKQSTRQYEYLPFLFMWICLGAAILTSYLVDWYRKKTTNQQSDKEQQSGKWANKVNKSQELEDFSIEHKTTLKQVSQSVSKNTLMIEFDNLELKVQPKAKCCGLCCCWKPPVTTRLHSISGSLRPGELTAVMGPSGSGKSTFVNVVCGKIDRTSGTIRVNGKEVELSNYKEYIGFVPQHDVLDDELTVFEALQFSADLRLKLPKEKRRENVVKIMIALDLYQKRNQLISVLSGGQKKRVNIGVELVAAPSALFLDEPTTGLDATTAQSIMRILAKLARDSNIIVCAVIHQPRPSITAQFDQMILLAQGGRAVWMGSEAKAMEHFEKLQYTLPENCDLPDFFSDVISGVACPSRNKMYEIDEKKREEYVNTLVNQFNNMSNTTTSDTKTEEFVAVTLFENRSVNFCTQLLYYFLRTVRLRLVRSNKAVVDAFAHLFSGTVIGIIFNTQPILVDKINVAYGNSCPNIASRNCTQPLSNDIGMFGFYTVLGLSLAGALSSIGTFGGSRKKVFWREASHGASTCAYFFGENFYDVLGTLVNAIFYTSSIQLMVPLKGPVGLYWLFYVVLSFTVTGVGYIISIGIREKTNATVTMVILGVCLTLFEGFVDKVGDYAYWCYSFWAGRAVSNIEYINGYNLNTTVPAYCEEFGLFQQDNCFQDDDLAYISFYDYAVPTNHRVPNLTMDFIMIVVLGMLSRGIAFLFLKYADADKRR